MRSQELSLRVTLFIQIILQETYLFLGILKANQNIRF